MQQTRTRTHQRTHHAVWGHPDYLRIRILGSQHKHTHHTFRGILLVLKLGAQLHRHTLTHNTHIHTHTHPHLHPYPHPHMYTNPYTHPHPHPNTQTHTRTQRTHHAVWGVLLFLELGAQLQRAGLQLSDFLQCFGLNFAKERQVIFIISHY